MASNKTYAWLQNNIAMVSKNDLLLFYPTFLSLKQFLFEAIGVIAEYDGKKAIGDGKALLVATLDGKASGYRSITCGSTIATVIENFGLVATLDGKACDT